MNEYQEIQLKRIVLSPLPSQVRRRARFDDARLEELAESVRRHGVVNPITVRWREAEAVFELVAGERRFLAAQRAGLETIPTTIREIDDTAAAEIQLIENGQRQDQHPLDEAFDFLDMKQLLGFDENEIALRVGKPLGFVRNRIKLTELHEDVRAALEENRLPIGHALEIAKYPADDHPELLYVALPPYGNSVLSLNQLVQRIDYKFLRKLSTAKFSLHDDRLHPDGRVCSLCPERTGAQPDLFGENFGDDDRCLNAACWNGKELRLIQISRKFVARDLAGGVEPLVDEAVRDVPELVDGWYHDKDAAKGRNLIDRNHFKIIGDGPDCDRKTRGVFVTGENLGKPAWICRDKTCSVHWPFEAAKATSNGEPVDDAETKRIRKEEIFDSKVAEAVRRRVLKRAAEQIDETAFKFAFAEDMVVVFWRTYRREDFYAATVCREALGLPDLISDDQIRELDATTRARLVFLMTFAERGAMGQGDNWHWKSQADITSLAAEAGINYAEIDAEERLAQAPPKHKDEFRAYLEELRAGNQPRVPRIWSEKWRAE